MFTNLPTLFFTYFNQINILKLSKVAYKNAKFLEKNKLNNPNIFYSYSFLD
jgi:hypothetical protein